MSKTKSMIFSSKRVKPDHPPLFLDGVGIENVPVHDHLGVTLSFNLFWRSHILKTHQKASRKLNLLKPLKYKLSRFTLDVLYTKALVRSSLEYADVVWDGCLVGDNDLLESLQLEGARVVTGAIKGTNKDCLLRDTSWAKLSLRRKIHKLIMMYKLVYKIAPPYLSDLCPSAVSMRSSYSFRSSRNLVLPLVRTERHKNSFLFSATQLWNNLPLELRLSSSVGNFKYNVLAYIGVSSCNPLYYVGNRFDSVDHSRFRCNNSTFNHDLFY